MIISMWKWIKSCFTEEHVHSQSKTNKKNINLRKRHVQITKQPTRVTRTANENVHHTQILKPNPPPPPNSPDSTQKENNNVNDKANHKETDNLLEWTIL